MRTLTTRKHPRAGGVLGELSEATLVVAPARPGGSAIGEKQICFSTRRDPAGETVGLAFTNVGRLARAMGQEQPWVILPLGTLKEYYNAAGVDRLVVDPRFQEPHLGGR